MMQKLFEIILVPTQGLILVIVIVGLFKALAGV